MASGEQDCDTQDDPKRKKLNLEEDQKSRSAHTGVSVNVNAETRGTVNAPVFTENTFTAPVTFNFSTAGHEPRKISETETAEKQTEKQDDIDLMAEQSSRRLGSLRRTCGAQVCVLIQRCAPCSLDRSPSPVHQDLNMGLELLLCSR